MRLIGEFTYAPGSKFTPGAKLVIQAQRGIEIGEHVPLTCTGCDRSITPRQIEEWIEASGDDTYAFKAGRILREATAADLAEYARIQASSREKRALAQEAADRCGLPIKVIECECPFGGERIIFYFTAAERVDFRSMVKDLAKEYRTRIEMRQIGARDEARIAADYETCGREVCCKAFLKTLRPISMRMAKVQKATLDPSQVSGRCGRLKCCLRFEHVAYEELDKQLPRTGVRIRTKHGEGVIINRQILTQLVQFRADDDSLTTVAIEDITAVDVKAEEKTETSQAPAGKRASSKDRPASAREDAAKKGPRQPSGRSRQRKRTESTESTPRAMKPPGAATEKETQGQPSRRRKRRRRKSPESPRPPRSNGNEGSPPKNKE